MPLPPRARQPPGKGAFGRPRELQIELQTRLRDGGLEAEMLDHLFSGPKGNGVVVVARHEDIVHHSGACCAAIVSHKSVLQCQGPLQVSVSDRPLSRA